MNYPPPGPFSEHDLIQRWNAQADNANQWDSLDTCEQLAWAQTCAIKTVPLQRSPVIPRDWESELHQVVYDIIDEELSDHAHTCRVATLLLQRQKAELDTLRSNEDDRNLMEGL
jgi:hypothetical protein